MTKTNEVIDLVQVINEAVDKSFIAGMEYAVTFTQGIMLEDKSTADMSEEEKKLKEAIKGKLVGKWLPKTEMMRGDVEK